MRSWVMIVSLAGWTTGCASMADVERGYLNHPAMDLTARLTPDPAPALSPLGDLSAASGSGACFVCAH